MSPLHSPATPRMRHAAPLLAVLLLAACAGTPPTPQYLAAPAPVQPPGAAGETAARFGVSISGLHLSAHGYILDLRYRVLDPEKAAPLLDARRRVQLLDEGHGARLGVPSSPVIGGMRQTSRNYVVYQDRDYFILFVNPGRAVRPGDVLKLAVDGTAVAEVTVQ